MGDPRKQKKKFEAPRFAWRSDLLLSELKLLGKYGLRNKHELWRYRTMLSRFRSNARSLLSKSTPETAKIESDIIGRFRRLGILTENSGLNNVLDLGLESILERRLQTLVLRKGLAKTIYQGRQLITHGHIVIGNQKVFSPSFLVPSEDEDKIDYASSSPLTSSTHPLRQLIEGETELGEGEIHE